MDLAIVLRQLRVDSGDGSLQDLGPGAVTDHHVEHGPSREPACDDGVVIAFHHLKEVVAVDVDLQTAKIEGLHSTSRPMSTPMMNQSICGLAFWPSSVRDQRRSNLATSVSSALAMTSKRSSDRPWSTTTRSMAQRPLGCF